MPAKAKSKNPVKRTVKKTVQVPIVPIVIAPPESSSVSVTPPQPPPPRPVPVAEPVENLEQILDDGDTKDSVVDRKNHVVFAFGILAAVAIIVGAIVVFGIYLGSAKMPEEEAEHQTKTIPTATPTPAFVRSNVTFEVINASGVSGAATKAKDALTQIGYTVLSVGNGKKQATSSLLLARNLSATDVSEILADANSLFSISSSSGDLTGTTASARIILGNK